MWLLDGSLNTHTNALDFFYDATGNAYALKHNGTVYYYITNLQGDVMSIVDGSGNVVASYQYDPYGNIVTQSGTLADTNPLRYRGYYYDSETGFYYLQSRYYDPEIGRFINADVYASTGQGLLGYNMFAYCRNNPVCRIDASGYGDVDFQESNIDDADVTPDEHELGSGMGSFDPYQTALDSGCSNPYGRSGGPRHVGLIDSLRLLFNALGWDVSTKEKRIPIPNEDKYRYPDLIVDTGKEKIYVQVGKSTGEGNPIAREQRAIDDLAKTGNKVWFFSYDD